MANVALLTRHTFSRSSSLASQPEVDCRGPEVEKGVDVCDGVGPFRGGVAPCRVSEARRSGEIGGGIGKIGSEIDQTGSSFRTGSSSKHFRSSSTVDSITADELASLVAAGNGNGQTGDDVMPAAVVVDCRCFVAFNANHVLGAFNATCADKFSRKRLSQGRPVADLVMGGPSTDASGGPREVFRRLAQTAAASPSGLFVAYDDDTTNLDALQESHPLRLLTSSLTASGYRTKYLEGKGQSLLFCSLAVLDPTIGHIMDVISLHLSLSSVILIDSSTESPVHV